jgi:hypothetical protein
VHAVVSGEGFAPAWRAAAAALGEEEAEHHAPHVSLCYRYGPPYSHAEVAALDAAAAGDSACAFVVERIAIATTHGLWPTWDVLEEIPLRGVEAAPAES